MPISVVVGGQFGSEGKGKTALEIARRTSAAIVVRVGGTNSGHTAVDDRRTLWALRQLPVSVLAPDTVAVLPPGALVDPEILLSEMQALRLDRRRLVISPYATVILPEDKEAEQENGLIAQIGSTGSGTGAALIRRIGRHSKRLVLAKDHPTLKRYLGNTCDVMREALNRNRRIVIEGSQGFGLSVLHGGYYPKATSRDTTAGTFLGEAGLSPRDVDDITLVVRAHPIRVAGNSGTLLRETTWAKIAKTAGLPKDYKELTTATKKIRRVGLFDAKLVKRAIETNNPTRVVLNHFDYVHRDVRKHIFHVEALRFLRNVEKNIGRRIDWIGTDPASFVERSEIGSVGRSSKFKVSLPS